MPSRRNMLFSHTVFILVKHFFLMFVRVPIKVRGVYVFIHRNWSKISLTAQAPVVCGEGVCTDLESASRAHRRLTDRRNKAGDKDGY